MSLLLLQKLRTGLSPAVKLLAAALLVGAVRPASALDDGLARTPPMGWNSWNKFGCSVSDTLVRGIADAMAASGMKDAGYQYVVIDDCWAASRDAAGEIVPDASRFPDGMKALADHVHSRGLKFGLYTDAGTTTCSGRPGSLGHELQDARTYAAWGVDYVKEDWCSTGGLDPATQYAKFRDALASSGAAVVLSICDWGIDSPWSWGPTTGHLWRTSGDIGDSWNAMIANLDSNSTHASAARPGAWNDPDMLEIGNGGMSSTEYHSHMSLWAIMAAPLIAGNDVRSMSQDTLDTLTNPEVIAVDQDPAGIQGTKVSDDGAGLQVWAKKLQSGAVAVALFNRSASTATLTATWSAVGLPSGSATVRDLWARADRGSFTDSYSASVPSHGTVLVKIAAASGSGETLTVTRAGAGAGSGTVTSSPSGISCGSTCSAAYASGTAVTLTATPASGSTFSGFSGACVGTGTCVVTMTAAQAVTATFVTSGGTCAAASGYGSGNFDTTGPMCFTVGGTIHGWGCSNADGRSVTVNGTAVTCGQLPLPGSSPYTFSFSAGTYPWASVYWW